MSLKVIVQGSEYQLDEETKNIMEFFNEADALEKIEANQPFEITAISENTWKEILRLCKIVNNKFPQIAKIKTNDPKQVIGNDLAEALTEKSPEQINDLYRAAHTLKIKNLRRSIAAIIACKVYIKPTLEDYNKKRAELSNFLSNVEIDENDKLTAADSRKMKEQYTFMN